MNNDVTVLIPTFQRARYLDQLLESISKQTIYGEINCLISDSNSKDNTLEIIKKWEKSKKLNIETIINKSPISAIENWKNLKSNSEKMIFELQDRKDKIIKEIEENQKNPERLATKKGQNIQNLDNTKKRSEEFTSGAPPFTKNFRF